MDFVRARAIIEQAENLLDTPVGNSPETIQRFETLIRELLTVCDRNAVIDGKCESALDFVRIAFAPRARPSYTREDAAQFARGDLTAAGIHLRQLEHVR